MSFDFPRDLVEFLCQRDAYPHKPDTVEHIQTHISHVFIAPPYVYKFKKPVNFDFLDFSTLEKRKYYCDRELELNRRLCDQIYLEVIPVYRDTQSYSFQKEGKDNPVEYCVKMKQLSGDHFLIQHARNGDLNEEHIEQVAGKLTQFYSTRQPNKKILQWGEPEKIRLSTDENFQQTESFIGHTLSEITYTAIRTYTDSFLDQQEHLFRKRITDHRIVDGHGDLHLEHIHITGDRICIYDCIEFNDRFRYLDIASDIAFLAMDLDFNGLPFMSRLFIKKMTEKLDDPDMLQMINFYKCYRAYVRGKVKSMESGEEEVGEEKRRRAAEKASHYFTLSLNYALFRSRPVVLVFIGRVASGKSTLARKVSEVLDIRYHSSDIERKKLAGLSITNRTPESERVRLYQENMTKHTYNKLFKYAISESEQGKSVVIDATFGNPENRARLISHLNKINRSFFFIEVSAPEHIRKKRLRKRTEQQDIVSDARLEDFDVLDSKYQSPDEIDSARLIRINTDKPVEKSLEVLFQTFAQKHSDHISDRKI